MLGALDQLLQILRVSCSQDCPDSLPGNRLRTQTKKAAPTLLVNGDGKSDQGPMFRGRESWSGWARYEMQIYLWSFGEMEWFKSERLYCVMVKHTALPLTKLNPLNLCSLHPQQHFLHRVFMGICDVKQLKPVLHSERCCHWVMGLETDSRPSIQRIKIRNDPLTWKNYNNWWTIEAFPVHITNRARSQ